MPRVSRTASVRSPRHRALRGRRLSLSGAFSSLVAVTAGAVVALLGTGATYALWKGEAPLDATTITSGILDLEVTGAIDSAHWSALLPGEHHVQFVTVENTGNIPIDLSALATQTGGDSGSFELRLELVADAASCPSSIGGVDALGTPVPLGAIQASVVARLCVDVSLSSTALPGHDAVFALSLTADQVT